ncbi:MAG: peptidoglycan DD-metalloendopeptidase family protein [Clostridia bacterium]|nr:peptidoglycan DD-metalloendopeptidase family protein [Clostridia bacterium]
MRNRKKNEENKSKGAKSNAGFYIALAVCIVTVAAAAWTTYGSVAADIDSAPQESSGSELQTANDVSGESYEKNDTIETESSAPQESSEPEKNSSAQEPESSVGTVTSKPPEKNTEIEKAVPKVYFPVEGGDVVKPFSITKPVYSKTTADWRAHKGIDIKAKQGAAVRAVSEGTVMDVTDDPLYGNTIIISQSGCTVRYCGLSGKPVVKKGDHIDAGTVIGYVGSVPCEQLDEPHIHMEAINGDKYIDPMSLFDENLSK